MTAPARLIKFDPNWTIHVLALKTDSQDKGDVEICISEHGLMNGSCNDVDKHRRDRNFLFHLSRGACCLSYCYRAEDFFALVLEPLLLPAFFHSGQLAPKLVPHGKFRAISTCPT
ncbi:unnamed protein product [Victoria cruziana]